MLNRTNYVGCSLVQIIVSQCLYHDFILGQYTPIVVAILAGPMQQSKFLTIWLQPCGHIVAGSHDTWIGAINKYIV